MMFLFVELFFECYVVFCNDVVCVLCGYCFDQYDFVFFVGNWKVMYVVWYDVEFVGVEVYIGVVFEGDFQVVVDYEEQFVFIWVVVLDEFVFEFGDFDVLIVDLVDDVW